MSRAIRVGDFIRDEISKIILHEVRDPRLAKHLAVNDVIVSKDLSYADIYVSSFEHDNDLDQQAVAEVHARQAQARRDTSSVACAPAPTAGIRYRQARGAAAQAPGAVEFDARGRSRQ